MKKVFNKKINLSKTNLIYITIFLSIFLNIGLSQFYFILIDFSNYNQNILNLDKKIQNLKERICKNCNKSEIYDRINELKAVRENKNVFYDPSYNEAYDFIKKDDTDKNTFHDSDYNCAHFARDVNNNTIKQGIRCAYVIINLSSGTPHAIIAFNTTDEGVVFFEPQNDQRVFLEIGKDYWNECIENGEYKIQSNIVLDYTIYW